MCQTSSLISQTKAGEFDLSEFRSFVPMNKTLLLLDVTRTYQVTDSPFELGGDTVQEPRCRMKQKRWSFYCISSALAVRIDNLHKRQDMQVYRTSGDWLLISFLMNDALKHMKERRTNWKESWFVISSHVSYITCANPFDCAKIWYVGIKRTVWELNNVYILL